MLDIPEEEQIRRIEKRQGMDDYQLKRIKQSRSDFEDVIEQFARQKQNHNLTDRLSIQFNWWKATDGGGFEILNIS